MKFQLIGMIRYSTGSCHDDKSKSIDQEFEAATQEAGIKKGKSLVAKYHKKYSHLTDYQLSATLRAVEEIWKTHFVEGQKAVSAFPARPAQKAVQPHFHEQRL